MPVTQEADSPASPIGSTKGERSRVDAEAALMESAPPARVRMNAWRRGAGIGAQCCDTLELATDVSLGGLLLWATRLMCQRIVERNRSAPEAACGGLLQLPSHPPDPGIHGAFAHPAP